MTNKTLKMIVGAICAVGGVFCAYGEAQNLYFAKLTGNQSWGGKSVWTNSVGEFVTFTNGDNVSIGCVTNTVTLSLSAGIEVGDFYVNVTNVWGTRFSRWEDAMAFNGGSFAELGHFEKLGSGTLKWNSQRHSFTNDIYVTEGTLYINPPEFVRTEDYAYRTDMSMLGSLEHPHTIYVGDGDSSKKARLDLYAHASKYMWCWEHQKPDNLLFYINGGVVGSGSYGTRPVFARVILQNGGKLHGPANNPMRARMMLNDDIKVKRGDVLTASSVSLAGNATAMYLSGAGKTIAFDVDEVTSAIQDGDGWADDGVSDLVVSAIIEDSSNAIWFGDPTLNYRDPVTNTVWDTCSPWIKTGPGTMELKGVGSATSSNTGDIEIREGRVRCFERQNGSISTTLGNPYANRRIVLHPGTELEFAARRVWGAYDSAVLLSDYAPIVLSNATLKVTGPGDQFRLEMYGDAEFSPIVGDNSTRYAFSLVGNNKFAVNNPILWTQVSGSYSLIYLDTFENTSFENRVEGDAAYTNYFGSTKIELARAANGRNGALGDLVIGLQLRNRPNYDVTAKNVLKSSTSFVCGLVKSGDGILALVNADHVYTGDTIVEEGGLQIDSSVRTNVIVKAGGYVGGSGKIGGVFNNVGYGADLTIEEGGGLLVNATNTASQVTVNGTVTIPSKGHLHICNYDGEPGGLSLKGIAYPQATQAGSVVGADNVVASQWTASVDGWTKRENKRLLVSKGSDGLLQVDYLQTGLKVIVR